MNQCPKCGGRRILGPRYERGPFLSHGIRGLFSGEALIYTCGTCGYKESAATLDASSAKPSAPASGFRSRAVKKGR